MQRRRLLQLGVGAAAVLGLAGAGVAWMPGAFDGGRLSAHSRSVFASLAVVMLEGSLPTDPKAREGALQRHLERVDATVAGLPAASRRDLGTLLALLGTAPGRLGLMGTTAGWDELPPARLASALQSMRDSPVALRQQTYAALRELTVASYFADRETWSQLGYPGPVPI